MEPIDVKPRVILVTDGDQIARTALETAATRVGARVISRSAGNPTPLSGAEIGSLIHTALHDPVVVMLDDNGVGGKGRGEAAIEVLMKSRTLRIIGVLAVASNTQHTRGAKVDFSVDCHGHIVDAGVNKHGFRFRSKRKMVYGDTVDILRRYHKPLLIGIGDIGKMKGRDDVNHGCPITTEALKLIIELDPLAPCYHPQ
ncbi:MAG: stage V sporulation protein AE [Firmicutes bacterium]|nr:stage V sporulation protein AE [Bacillota bacterium]